MIPANCTISSGPPGSQCPPVGTPGQRKPGNAEEKHRKMRSEPRNI